MLIKLYSVASAIETTNNLVYAMYQDGKIDKDSATDIDFMPDSWKDAIDDYDKEMIYRYCNDIKL